MCEPLKGTTQCFEEKSKPAGTAKKNRKQIENKIQNLINRIKIKN